MPLNAATPKMKSLAGDAARNVARGDRAVSRTATSLAAASTHGCTDDVPTPFYDQLMSMIDATALENRRVAQINEIDAASRVGHHRWSIHPLVPCIAGLVVVAAIGRVLLVSEVSQRQPPMVTADGENALKERLHVVNGAATADDVVDRSARGAEPDGMGSLGVGEKWTAIGGVGAGPPVAARSDERPLAASVAGQPMESLGSGAGAGGDGPAVARASTKAMHTDPIAPAMDPASKQPLPGDAPPSLPSAIETGSIERASDTAAIRGARVISDVNMRAGPSNGHAVLAAISRGRPVEVISCGQWCEVIFAGQRGWIYKGFIGASPIRGER